MSDLMLLALAIILLVVSAVSFRSYIKQVRSSRFPKRFR